MVALGLNKSLFPHEDMMLIPQSYSFVKKKIQEVVPQLIYLFILCVLCG